MMRVPSPLDLAWTSLPERGFSNHVTGSARNLFPDRTQSSEGIGDINREDDDEDNLSVQNHMNTIFNMLLRLSPRAPASIMGSGFSTSSSN